MSDTESILHEAYGLVHGARQESYGHPLDDLTRTGRMWGAILGTEDIPAETVALCLVAVKISREVNGHKHDNLVDMAGYAEVAALARAERERRDRTYPLFVVPASEQPEDGE